MVASVAFIARTMAAVSLCVLLVTACQAAPIEAFFDAAAAGHDFAVQGEYSGDLKLSAKSAPVGLQIVSLGDGKFDAVLFHGGLPGAGWKPGDTLEQAAGRTAGDATTFVAKSGSWTARLDHDAVTISGSGSEKLGTLQKTQRQSPTLGAKPPAGAVVLFDGTSGDQFRNATLTDDKLLNVGATSKAEFGSFSMHLEFRTPYMPKASRIQDRGNSGLYLQNRYELQICDSFGLDCQPGHCGGIYSVKAPSVNMCLPPLAWQTYDVDFTAAAFAGEQKLSNARVTVRHNGVLIIDDLELKGLTPGGARIEAPGRGPLMLQHHGCPVHFRNIWVVEK